MFRSSPIAPALIILISAAHAAVPATYPATAPASTQPVLTGRDTPEGAMNVFNQALDNGDLATLADSYNQPLMPKADLARILLTEHRLYRTISTHFDPAEVESIYHNMQSRPYPPLHQYVADDFEHPPDQPTVVYGKSNGDVRTDAMQQSPDGI